jgi:spore maturation protein CgeB
MMDSKSILVADGDHHRYTLGRMCARAFAELGHEVRYVDTNTYSLPLLGTDIGIGSMRDRFVETVARVDPDLVFVIKGDDIPRSTLESAQRKSDAAFCNWNPDNPFMTRSQERRLDTYLDALPVYDCVFIWSEQLMSDLSDYGAERIEHLPFGFDPTVHYSAPLSEEYEAEVAFVGHTSDKRKQYMHALSGLEIDLAIYGDYWKRPTADRTLRKHVRAGTIYGEKYCSAFCSADIVVNIVSDHNLDAYNMRTFEIPATGSFMLRTDTPGQRKIFEEGKAAAYFEEPADLRRTVKRYLNNEAKREAVAASGRETVREHSYRNRMTHVLETVF